MLHIFWECSQGVGFRPMRWFRGLGSRCGGWVALVAIALQLALAFGHVHHDAYSHASEIAALTVADRGEPASPAAPHDHDYCAICTVLSLLSGAQGAAPPALPVPAATAAVAVVAEPERVHAAELCPAFQSRAPPFA
jgi:DUF2946 family protein